jgi:hypothetical protein
LVGSINNSKKDKNYILNTSLGADSNSPFLDVLNFLNDIKENPLKILKDKGYQNSFKKNAFLLKKNGIQIEKLFSLNHEFQKSYSFDEYLLYQNKELVYHNWELNKGNLSPNQKSIKLPNLKDSLIEFQKLNFLKLDYHKIQEIKLGLRQKSLKDSSEKKDINYFKSLISLGESSTNPIFLISKQTNLEEMIDILSKKEILNDYFPFSSEFDLNFLRFVFQKRFGN